jgi:hypothetical protein
LGVKSIIDSSKPAFEQDLPQVDAILDTVGGSTFQRCVAALKPGGKLVTSVSTQPLPAGAIFFYAEVTTARLQTLTTLFDAGRITARVGSVLPLSEARQAQACLRAHPTSPARSSCRSGTRSSARQDEILKVIVANPKMIAAYKAGVPGNGQPFPEGSMIVKLQWKQKKSTEAQFAVDVPDVFTQAFVMEKDSKRFPKTGGWGYAVFNYDAVSGKFTADAKSLSDCGNACHTAVKAKDYIFHPYEMR